jgi:hypothetical protein
VGDEIYVEMVRAHLEILGGAAGGIRGQEQRRRAGQLLVGAVEAYARVANLDDRDDARKVILSLLNHIAKLKDEPWFTQPEAQRDAIEETVAWNLGSAVVASAVAQELWDRWWALKRELDTDLAERTQTQDDWASAYEFWLCEVTDTEDKWRSAWEEWHSERHSG